MWILEKMVHFWSTIGVQIMQIKYSIKFELRPYGKDGKLQMIRIRVTYSGVRLSLSTGCSVSDPKFWDGESQLVVEGYGGPKGESARSINNVLRNCRDQMRTAFSYFEGNDIVPTVEQLKAKYLERLNGTVPKKPEESKAEKKEKEPGFYDVYDLFVREEGVKRAWTPATYEKMAALREDLVTFRPRLKFSQLTEATLSSFVVFLRDEKSLRTPRKAKGDRKDYDEDDVTGLLNSTIDKKLGYFKWFLKWATNKGYNQNLDYKVFRPNLKSTQKRVIYLTKEELNTLNKVVFDEKTLYLEPIRDVFLFCCFTGLRYSDATNLRIYDILDDHIEITTVKTADSIKIELNDVSKRILDKYKGIDLKGKRALPSLNNQNFNRDLKVLCKMAGIDEEIRITTYKGSERRDKVYRKWELVTSHCGRKTFIVNALSMGIPADIVMKWTGHKDYRAMKPYIDIVNSAKEQAMTKFNALMTP